MNELKENITYPDLNEVTSCKHFVNQKCINYWIGLDMIASIMLDSFAHGEHQAMARCSEGWYYISEDDKSILRSKYNTLAEKVIR